MTWDDIAKTQCDGKVLEVGAATLPANRRRSAMIMGHPGVRRMLQYPWPPLAKLARLSSKK